MKNSFFETFNSIIKLKVEGKNINNYIKRLIKDKINIIEQIPISYKEAIRVIKYSDDLKIKEFKKCFDIIYTNNNDFNDIIELIQKNS